jgi:hypothetical protein
LSVGLNAEAAIEQPDVWTFGFIPAFIDFNRRMPNSG